jgi:tyrosine-protein kinase Etk/Wzc
MVEKQEPEKGSFWDGIEILDIVHALLRRKVLIIAITAATAILSCCYSLTLPNIYAATAKVLPPQKETAGLSAMFGQMGGIAGIAAGAAKGNENELYISLMKSRSVESAVVQRLDLMKKWSTGFSHALRRLDAAVKVQAGRDGILVVTAEDADPKQAALLANTMVDELGRTMVRLNLTKAGSERLFLQNRLELVKKDMVAAENELKDFAQRNKIAHVETQANATVSGVARLKGELASKETELAVLRTSQSEESYEVKEAEAAIRRLRQSIGAMAGKGGGDGVPSLGDVPQLGLEYSRKMRDLKTQETLFEQLTKQYEMAKLNEAKDSSSLQVLDTAVPPEEKVRPHRSTVVMLATLIAFLSSVVLAFALEYLERMPDENRKVLENLKAQALSLR